MKKYQIEIKETLSKIIDIQANTPEDAIALVKDMYQSEIVVLDANNFVDVEYISR